MSAVFLLLGWLLVVAVSGFLALESTRAGAEQQLQEQAQQQALQLAGNMLQLQQQMQDLSQQFAGTAAADFPTWVAPFVLRRFPAVERIALLQADGERLLVQQITPLRLGGDIVPQQNLARQPEVAAALPALLQGRQQLFKLRVSRDEARFLAIYPLGHGPVFVALWFRPQRWLPPLGDSAMVRTLQMAGDVAPVTTPWSNRLLVREVAMVGEQRYWLTLQRKLQWSDAYWLLWLPLLLIWLLLLALCLASIIFRWRRQQLKQL